MSPADRQPLTHGRDEYEENVPNIVREEEKEKSSAGDAAVAKQTPRAVPCTATSVSDDPLGGRVVRRVSTETPPMSKPCGAAVIGEQESRPRAAAVVARVDPVHVQAADADSSTKRLSAVMDGGVMEEAPKRNGVRAPPMLSHEYAQMQNVYAVKKGADVVTTGDGSALTQEKLDWLTDLQKQLDLAAEGSPQMNSVNDVSFAE